LGSYLTLDGIPREIDDPSKVSKAPVTRADWNWKAAQIKLAIKEFLKQEMQWKQTPQNPSEQKLDTVVLLKQDAKWGNQQSKTEHRGKFRRRKMSRRSLLIRSLMIRNRRKRSRKTRSVLRRSWTRRRSSSRKQSRSFVESILTLYDKTALKHLGGVDKRRTRTVQFMTDPQGYAAGHNNDSALSRASSLMSRMLLQTWSLHSAYKHGADARLDVPACSKYRSKGCSRPGVLVSRWLPCSILDDAENAGVRRLIPINFSMEIDSGGDRNIKPPGQLPFYHSC